MSGVDTCVGLVTFDTQGLTPRWGPGVTGTTSTCSTISLRELTLTATPTVRSRKGPYKDETFEVGWREGQKGESLRV